MCAAIYRCKHLYTAYRTYNICVKVFVQSCVCVCFSLFPSQHCLWRLLETALSYVLFPALGNQLSPWGSMSEEAREREREKKIGKPTRAVKVNMLAYTINYICFVRWNLTIIKAEQQWNVSYESNIAGQLQHLSYASP